MRNALIILSLLFSTIASATDYYVSSSGNDSNNGLSSSTPWQTIAKVNSVFPTFLPGDRILFNRGDTFYGTITITKSGIVGNPITIGAYGTGDNPIITGLITLTSWTSNGGGIYYATLDVPRLNIVTLNGVVKGMGRFPNTGYLNYESHSGNTSITDNQLTDTPNWTGAEIGIRKLRWIIDRHVVTDHTNGTLTYSSLNDYGSNTTYTPTDLNGYFFQNHLSCLDDLGDWCYDANAKRLYMQFGGGVPGSYTVKAGSTEINLNTNQQSYININNISFEGANISGVYIKWKGTHININDCNFYSQGGDGLLASAAHSADINHIIITGGSITYALNDALNLTCDNAVIDGLEIKNAGNVPGACKSGDDAGVGIFINGNNNTVRNCNIMNIGWSGISFLGDNALIENNNVSAFCTVKDDGGGIYTQGGANLNTNSVIQNNFVVNTNGSFPGCEAYASYEAFGKACGIYMDKNSQNVKISGNTVSNCSWVGIFIHLARNIQIFNNTLYNNAIGQLCSEYLKTGEIVNIISSGNKFISKAANQPTYFHCSSVNENPNVIGTFDNNYYARPIDDNSTIHVMLSGTGVNDKLYSLAGWQTYTGEDANSYKSNVSTADTTGFFKFVYNITTSNITMMLKNPMIDVAGTKYSGSITLLPHTSAVLMLDPNPNFGINPLYVSSAVANPTPSILEMTYDLSLANIVPVASAFTVQVNSVVRAVNSVSILGNKVQLTLSSPVVYGNIVSVAYTKPVTNALQTPSGGLAASFSSQTVTNNVAPPTPPIYVSSAIENATPGLLQLVYNLNLANIVPVTSTFTVKVNSVIRSVSSVTISGTKVQLIFSSPVVYGDIITVDYTKPSSNQLQTASGGQAASFVSQTVTNNVASLTLPTLISSSVENATPSLLVMTYNMSLANLVPPASAFSVIVNSVLRTFNAVAVSGMNVQLTLASSIVYGDIVTITYTKPSSNPLQNPSGGQAVTISAQTVTNNVNSVVPVYVNSAVANEAPSILKMTYNMNLANIVPAASAFSVNVNSTLRIVNAVTVSGTKVQLFLASPIVYGDVVTFSYTKPASNTLQAISGGIAASISNQTVENNCSNIAPTINQPPVVEILNPLKGNKYETNPTITLEAMASDPDGSISKVEFYSGAVKLGELTSAPYTYTWKNVGAGSYSITAIAMDNLNATTTSIPIEFEVEAKIKYDADSEIINLYPNPNDGHFSIEFINPLQNERSKIVITDLAGKQIYNGLVSKEETLKQFDLSNMKSGIYVMMISEKEIFITKKFIIH